MTISLPCLCNWLRSIDNLGMEFGFFLRGICAVGTAPAAVKFDIYAAGFAFYAYQNCSSPY